MRKRCLIIPMCVLLITAFVYTGVGRTLKQYIPPDVYEIFTPAEAAKCSTIWTISFSATARRI